MKISLGKIIIVILAVLLLVLPLTPVNAYIIHILVLSFLFAYLAESWNILGGFCGQLSFGHVAFFGIGAYTSSLLFVNWRISPWIGMFAGGGLAAALALFFGWPCFKFGLKKAYFALATLAVSSILFYWSNSAVAITRGSLGVPLTHDFGILSFQFVSKVPYYYIAFAFMVGAVLITYKITNSKFGLRIKALREDEDAALSLGINVTLHKALTFALSAFLTAIGGTFYAQYVFYIDPSSVFIGTVSFDIIGVAVIGGMGLVLGPVVGAFIIKPLSEYLRMTLAGNFLGLHLIVYGILLMIVLMFMPDGVFGLIEKTYNRMLGKGEKNASAS